MSERVFITGLGQCSSLGAGVERFWTDLISRKSGMRLLNMDNPHGEGFGAPLTTPDELDGQGRLDWALQYAIEEAIRDASLEHGQRNRDITVIAASNFGDHFEMLDHGDFLKPVRTILARLGLQGEFWGISTACASGGGALGLAADLIRCEGAGKVLVCAFDIISSYNYQGLAKLRALSEDVIRPFDRNRGGTLLGEAAAALVLESESSAYSRGTVAYCELTGYGISNDGYHFTAPEPSGIGIRTAMEQALEESQMKADTVDHLNAHGTGTVHNDQIESGAVQKLFGDAAGSIPTTSIKASVGHTMGTAGALESIATVLSLRDGIVPPTLNYRERDPACDLDYVVQDPRRVAMTTAMCNSYGLWGCNASVIFSRRTDGRITLRESGR